MRREASLRRNDDSEVRINTGSGIEHERVRPRRRRPKRSVWRRLGLPVMICVIGFAGLAVVINKIARPFEYLSRERAATADLQSQLDAYRAENARLERNIKYLKTPEGAAQAARELGWVKSGEITLVLTPDGNLKPKK